MQKTTSLTTQTLRSTINKWEWKVEKFCLVNRQQGGEHGRGVGRGKRGWGGEHKGLSRKRWIKDKWRNQQRGQDNDGDTYSNS